MTIAWSQKRALVASVLIIVVTNAVALGGAAYNRSGEPESTLELSERELAISHRDWLDADNSGIDLVLRWRARIRESESTNPYSYYSWNRELHWLSEEQKQQLGFATPADTSSDDARARAWDPPSRQAFVVLENDGEAYRAAVGRARQRVARQSALAAANPGVKELDDRLAAAREELVREESRASRLFVIDVDLNADALRARHPQRSQYAVVRARLDAQLQGESQSLRSIVYVESLDIETVSLPHAFRAIVEPLSPRNQRYSYEERAPRFEATVQWGRRFEPWITELRALDLRGS